MKKLALMCVLGMICLLNNKANAQGDERDIRNLEQKLFVQDWLGRNVPLGQFINYKNRTATLSDFTNKMIIFGFWFTSCTVCIQEFPKELELQKKFGNDIQIILVTYQPAQDIESFLKSWELRNNRQFFLPVIVSDTLLRKAFHQYYNPNYVWVLPNGKIVGQTSQHMVNDKTIQSLLNQFWSEKNEREANNDIILFQNNSIKK